MDDKTIRSIPFDGRRENYLMWASKFTSYCELKDCAHVLFKDYKDAMPSDETTLPKPDLTIEDAQDDSVIQYNLQRANRIAYALLSMSITDSVTFNALSNAKTTKLTKGCAYTAWQNIESLYKGTSNANKFELEQKFNHSELKSDTKNPDEWFAELDTIRVQLRLDFKLTIDDEKMVSHIVYNVHPKIYQTTLAIIKRELNNGQAVKLEDLKKDLRQVYAQFITSAPRDKKDTVLVAHNGKKFPKKFKGDCRICGKKGHKAGDC
jgi:gag-polypeptide of LTR copia-type